MKIIWTLSLIYCVTTMKFKKSENSVYNILHSFLSEPEMKFKSRNENSQINQNVNKEKEVSHDDLKMKDLDKLKANRFVNKTKTTTDSSLKNEKPSDKIEEVYILPQNKRCNDNWDYSKKGTDWECICREGNGQSPINLPLKEQAVHITENPFFDYSTVSSTVQETTYDESFVEGEKINIIYDRKAIRVYHPNMGKIVSENGEVFIAEEISFHTPSEHKIADESFDMEMQVVHFNRSKGDVSKQVVLCFLFKKYPKAFNKLLDQLDFFNLPNQNEERKDILQDFSIANIFLNSEDGNASTLEPFSFYKYEGSLTTPPCTESTVYYVASDPIPLSLTVIELFKEALKKSQVDPSTGNLINMITDEVVENNRGIQPLNERIVFYFDPNAIGLESYMTKTQKIKPQGRFDKITHEANEYFYVKDEEQSSIPGL